jgi:ribonuclease BN (tRNA processing enzyme)
MILVRLTVVGSSPAWPNPGGAQSGYLIEGPGRLLLDCGPGVLARLREETSWPQVDAIAITHFHLDHCGDLVPWAWGAMFGPGAGSEAPELHLPPGGRALLSELAGCLGGFPDMFERTFRSSEYAEGVPVTVAGFQLLPVRMQHYGMDSYGFRVANGDTALAYSGDAAPGDKLVELARDSDLFLCEATLSEGEGEPRGHLSLAEAESAFRASGARRLVVTHRPLERPLDREVELAYDGLVIELGEG